MVLQLTYILLFSHCISSDTDVIDVLQQSLKNSVYAYVSNSIVTHFTLAECSQYEWASLAIKNADFHQVNIGHISNSC
jgi:hypothetical protein